MIGGTDAMTVAGATKAIIRTVAVCIVSCQITVLSAGALSYSLQFDGCCIGRRWQRPAQVSRTPAEGIYLYWILKR